MGMFHCYFSLRYGINEYEPTIFCASSWWLDALPSILPDVSASKTHFILQKVWILEWNGLKAQKWSKEMMG